MDCSRLRWLRPKRVRRSRPSLRDLDEALGTPSGRASRVRSRTAPRARRNPVEARPRQSRGCGRSLPDRPRGRRNGKARAVLNCARRWPSSIDRQAAPRTPVLFLCLVTDVQMPGMTGSSSTDISSIRATRFRRFSSPPTRMRSTRNRALKDGVVCYLCKPVDDDHLERCLHSALESGKPHEENS